MAAVLPLGEFGGFVLIAFSSAVAAGSREENASKQKSS
jgi:hypothetical protein